MKPETAARILAASRSTGQAAKQLQRARKREIRTAIDRIRRGDEQSRTEPMREALKNARKMVLKGAK